MGRKTCYNTAVSWKEGSRRFYVALCIGGLVEIIAFYNHLHGIFNRPIKSQMPVLSLLS